MDTKTCLGPCGQDLPLEAFGVYRFGRRPWCNKCRAAKESERRQNLTEEQRQHRREVNREAGKRYRKSKKGRENARRDNGSEKGKARRKRWAASSKGKASLQAAQQRLTRRNRAWVQQEKLRRGCVDCGYNEHPAALDFDHIGDDKLFDVSKTMGRSLEAIQAEIAKCVVRCSNCHRIKTFEARQAANDKRRIKDEQ